MSDKAWGIAAYALLQNSEGKYLFLRRSPDSKTNPGRWEPPGGKLDPEERLDEALRREVFEEAGLQISVRRLLGAIEFEVPAVKVACLIMEGDLVTHDVKLSSEHDSHRWVRPSEVLQIDLPTQFRRFFAGEQSRRTVMPE
ncbi:MAG: NUDIX domain-containing protein [Vulcanimicrobiaceae bacterium]